MGTATIEKGSKVETVIKGEVTGQDSQGRNIVITEAGATVTIPKDASTYVTAKPLPKEPKGGSLVHYGSAIYKRDSYDGWYRVDKKETDYGSGGRLFYTWEKLNDQWGRGMLTRLVDDKTAGADDLTAGTKTFGSSSYYTVSAKVGKDVYGDPEVTLTTGIYGTGQLSKSAARSLAFAILRATGGQ